MRAGVEYIELRKRRRAGVDQCRDERAGLGNYANEHGNSHECATFDGFRMLLTSNRDSFATVRDVIACKPAVIAEINDWVATASESRAWSGLPDVESARVSEPDPEVIYAWSR